MRLFICLCLVLSCSTSYAQEQDPEPAASVLLEAGFAAFGLNKPQEALIAFRAAVATGVLSDAGRAVSYWHIAECERVLYHEDQMAEAFFTFAVVAQDIIGQGQQADFIAGFKLPLRLSMARAILNTVWVERSANYGRSIADAILVYDVAEFDYFVATVEPCATASDREVDRYVAETNDAIIERISVSCKSENVGETYYLVHTK